MASHRNDQVIAALAASRCNVVDAESLRRHGIGRSVVSRRVASGSMAVLLPGTYAVGPSALAPTMEQWAVAGVLKAGASGHLCGDTAARRRGIWTRSHDESIHVATLSHGLRGRGPVTFHNFARMHESRDHSIVDGIPTQKSLDLLHDLGRTLSPWQLASVVREIMFHEGIELADVEAMVHSWTYHPYVKTARQAIELVRSGSAGTRSAAEDRFLELWFEQGLPEPLVNVRGAMGMPSDEPDFACTELKKDIEIDGGYHREALQVGIDAKRDEAARGLGWDVLRIDASRLYKCPRVVMREVRRFLAS